MQTIRRAAMPLLAATSLAAQANGPSLAELVAGLTTTTRVLVVGMHPDDEDSQLLAWLARGQHVQTAFLSVTRGESAGNFLGPAGGATLGAARTQETLLARRIDGAAQFFTRMYDFGYARSDSELFARWNRDSLVADMVQVIRSFRPHVIVANTSDSSDTDLQHRALDSLVREARAAAADSQRFKALDFGDPWHTASAFVRDPAFAKANPQLVAKVDAGSFDALLGSTYAAIAEQARAQARSQGLRGMTSRPSPEIGLRHLTPRSGERVDSSGVTSFDSVPETSLLVGAGRTTLATLAAGATPIVRNMILQLIAHADSARADFTPMRPGTIVSDLVKAATIASAVRDAVPACRHPARVISLKAPRAFGCDQPTLDLDASLDLVNGRVRDALLGAAQVTVEAIADRELLAASDTATVTVRVANNGTFTIAVERVTAWGDVDTASAATDVPAGTTVEIKRRVTQLSQKYQWWMGSRVDNRYTVPVNSLDGVLREPRMRRDTAAPSAAAMQANGTLAQMVTAGVAIPEGIRRISDVTVTMSVAGTRVSVSATPVFRYADAVVGLQERPLAGVPDVTLNLNRAISFVPANQAIDREMHVSITSHSDRSKLLRLRVVTPPGLRDSLAPNAFRMGARELRDVTVQVRGTMEPGEKKAFGVVGSISGLPPFSDGFRTTQYPELLPIRVNWQSGMWLQPVEITVPKSLFVVYVEGVSDESYLALQDVGISVAVIPAADLIRLDLKRITTVVFGARAFEAHPELLLQIPRFQAWARQTGGTILIQRGGLATLRSGALPHFVDFGNPVTQRISDPNAPVTRIATAPTLLQWPNIIGPNDWKEWSGERAPFVPTQADPAYQRVIETHNPGDKPNQNAILVASLGKGRLIYSALTLDEQIAAGHPGALRILVNLLCAGLTPPGVQ